MKRGPDVPIAADRKRFFSLTRPNKYERSKVFATRTFSFEADSQVASRPPKKCTGNKKQKKKTSRKIQTVVTHVYSTLANYNTSVCII